MTCRHKELDFVASGRFKVGGGCRLRRGGLPGN